MKLLNEIVKFLKVNNPRIIFILILSLIILHGLFDSLFKVDNTTVLFVIILILLPYFHLIKKIKYGDFEAEITPEEVKEIEEKVEKIPKSEKKLSNIESADYLMDLYENDPELAFAKIRIEIEKRLRLLYKVYLQVFVHDNKINSNFSIRKITEELRRNEIISLQLAAALNDVMSIANRAIHGEVVSKKSTDKIIDMAIKIIEELDSIITEEALTPININKITSGRIKEFLDAKYKLITMVPYVDNPEERIYELSQKELETFLENYSEFTEHIVSLEKINN